MINGAQKFTRACKLSIETKTQGYSPNYDSTTNNNIVIPPEFSIEFEVVRKSAASSQTATFKVYNLGEATRKLIFADKFDADKRFRAVQFRAGYFGFTPMIFNGQILQASSKRVGVDMITTIECLDGGLAMSAGFSATTFAAGTPLNTVLAQLATQLPNTAGTPIVGNFDGTSTRGKVVFGNTWNIIRQESQGLAIIDHGQVKILQPNEAIASDIPVITSASGLLGSPARSGSMIEFDMLFEPRLSLGQIVQLESTTNALYNGTYKVMGFTHSGMISPSVCGPAKTTVQLWLGTAEIYAISGTVVT
jgi:hypothetical protein